MRIANCSQCDYCNKKTYRDISQVTETYYECDKHDFTIAEYNDSITKYSCDDNTADKKMKKIVYSLLLISSIALAQTEKNVGDFTKVTAFDKIDVNLVASTENKVILNGTNSEEVELVNKNGELKIRMPFAKMLSGETISATVYYTKLKAVEANEGSRIASKDAIDYVKKVFKTEINSVTDNPNVFIESDQIISGGNFHGQPLALALDFLAIALSELGSISERRTYQLISGLRNLPPFLVDNPGLNSGFMIPQYTAASIASQNKQLATPASVDSIVSSNGQEDHVSMGANAATKALRIMDNLERILAIELMNASQAIEFRRPLHSSDFIEMFLKSYREEVPLVKEDRILHYDIQKSVGFLNSFMIDIEL
mgnify:CR=1 FL=1